MKKAQDCWMEWTMQCLTLGLENLHPAQQCHEQLIAIDCISIQNMSGTRVYR